MRTCFALIAYMVSALLLIYVIGMLIIYQSGTMTNEELFIYIFKTYWRELLGSVLAYIAGKGINEK